jgi:copper(I)-binding protein
MNSISRLISASAAALLLAATVQAQTAPRVDDAWARPTVSGQTSGGAFLRITGGSAGDRLLGATTGVAKVAELHTMEMDGNVMRMRALPAIDIPAGQTVELKPGGLHVMFVGLTRALQTGTSFPLTLRFEKAGEVQVDVHVRTMPMAMGHGDMQDMPAMHKP